MRNVVAFVRGFPEHKMDGLLTTGLRSTRHTPVGNDQLVILHSQLSKSFLVIKLTCRFLTLAWMVQISPIFICWHLMNKATFSNLILN